MFQRNQDRVEWMAGAGSGTIEPGTSPLNLKKVASGRSGHLRPSAMVDIWNMGPGRSLLLLPVGLAWSVWSQVGRTRYRGAVAKLGDGTGTLPDARKLGTSRARKIPKHTRSGTNQVPRQGPLALNSAANFGSAGFFRARSHCSFPLSWHEQEVSACRRGCKSLRLAPSKRSLQGILPCGKLQADDFGRAVGA